MQACNHQFDTAKLLLTACGAWAAGFAALKYGRLCRTSIAVAAPVPPALILAALASLQRAQRESEPDLDAEPWEEFTRRLDGLAKTPERDLGDGLTSVMLSRAIKRVLVRHAHLSTHTLQDGRAVPALTSEAGDRALIRELYRLGTKKRTNSESVELFRQLALSDQEWAAYSGLGALRKITHIDVMSIESLSSSSILLTVRFDDQSEIVWAAAHVLDSLNKP